MNRYPGPPESGQAGREPAELLAFGQPAVDEERLQVKPPAERRPLGAQHQGPAVRVGVHRVERLLQPVDQVEVDRVAVGGGDQRHEADAVGDLGVNRAIHRVQLQP